MENNNKINIFDLQFPIIKNIQAKLLANDIKGMTSEEVSEAMEKMFKDIEEKTNYKVSVNITNNSPIKTLFPEEYINYNK
jgi:TRAP-type C4-dicarboxylate transport system substrate-binding protein